MSYITPKSVLNALNPFQSNQSNIVTNDTSRIEAFKRFIKDFDENNKGKVIIMYI